MAGYGYEYNDDSDRLSESLWRLNLSGSSSYTLSNADYPSSYQSTPRRYQAPESSSGASTSTTTNTAQSYASSYNSSRKPRTESVSSVPSRYTTLPPGEARAMAMQASQRIPARLSLPCEFVGFSGCEEVFRPDEIDAWIRHIERDHLDYKYPRCCVCWFCDVFKFDSAHPAVGGDRGLNFENRMHHIASHILEEGRTVRDIRPDFYLLIHLHKHNLISEERYKSAKRYQESLPMPHMYPPGWRPPTADRENLVPVHDKEDERRRLREMRHRKGKHHKYSHQHGQ